MAGGGNLGIHNVVKAGGREATRQVKEVVCCLSSIKAHRAIVNWEQRAGGDMVENLGFARTCCCSCQFNDYRLGLRL